MLRASTYPKGIDIAPTGLLARLAVILQRRLGVDFDDGQSVRIDAHGCDLCRVERQRGATGDHQTAKRNITSQNDDLRLSQTHDLRAGFSK